MGGNHIFQGPYPVREDSGGDGSDITGCCPKVIRSSLVASAVSLHIKDPTVMFFASWM